MLLMVQVMITGATNPYGVAFKMTDSLGNIIVTSLDLFPPTSILRRRSSEFTLAY